MVRRRHKTAWQTDILPLQKSGPAAVTPCSPGKGGRLGVQAAGFNLAADAARNAQWQRRMMRSDGADTLSNLVTILHLRRSQMSVFVRVVRHRPKKMTTSIRFSLTLPLAHRTSVFLAGEIKKKEKTGLAISPRVHFLGP